MKYQIGDRVKIVSYRTKNMNDEGLMDKYLGTVMTIKNIIEDIKYYEMEEDNGYWCWYEDLIDGLADSITQIDSVVESSSGHLIKGENDIYIINW